LKNKIIKIIGYIITLIAFLFIVKSLITMPLNFTQIKNPVAAVIWCVLLSVGYSVIVYISAFAWNMILEFIHKSKIPYRDLLPVYVKANIGKYLPGNVMHFAGRNILAGRLGFKHLDIAFSSVVEVITLIIAACLWSTLLAMNSFTSIISNAVIKMNWWLICTIFAFVLIILVILIWRFIIKGKYLQKYRHFLTRRFLILFCKLFLIYSLTLLIPGVFLAFIFSFLMQSTFSISKVMIIVSAYTVSWVAGYIVPGAPGGIGVRESILLLLLGQQFSQETAMLAILLHRLTSIAGDIIAFFVQPIIFKISLTKTTSNKS
jgi:uncharacterized membrane protein YbhN (UPF0104 family)